MPVALAITFPSLMAASTIQVHVTGLLNGSAIGEADISANIIPQHSTLHLQLSQLLDHGDAGGADDMASSDPAGYVPPDRPARRNR